MTVSPTQRSITFDVVGDAKPQGSKRAFVIAGKNGAKARATMKEDAGAAGVGWRDAVANAARREAETYGMLDGPLRLHLAFYFRMPKSRSKAERAAGCIRKTTSPDSSKLLRAVEDGLQAAGLIKDDARICSHVVEKYERLDGWVGVSIKLSTLEGLN